MIRLTEAKKAPDLRWASADAQVQVGGRTHHGRLSYLDGMRGVAALGVALFAHYGHFAKGTDTAFGMAQAPGYGLLAPLYAYSWTAVELFFVISGIVFAHVYADRLPSAKVFARRRFARLYPLHFFTLIVTAVLVALYQYRFGRAPVHSEDDLLHFLLNLFFLHYGIYSEGYSFNGPSYSLAIEAVMYGMFYCVARRLNLTVVAWALCVGGMLYLSMSHPWHHLPIVNNSIALGIVGFFGGVIIARTQRAAWLLPFMAAFLGLFGENLFSKVYAVIFMAMLFVGWSRHARLALDIPVLTWLGDRSLSIYLVHFPIQIGIMLVVGGDLPFASYGLLAGYALLVVSIAYMTHRYIEMPAQTWINAWNRPHPASQTVGAR